jgi:hypothetical protein
MSKRRNQRRRKDPIIDVPALGIRKRASEVTPEEQVRIGALLLAEDILDDLVREGIVERDDSGSVTTYRLRP